MFGKTEIQAGNLKRQSKHMKGICKLGKAQSLHSEATQRSLPDSTTNLCFLRVRVDDEGLEVRWGQRDSQSDVNPVYCVFDHLWYLRCYDACTR